MDKQEFINSIKQVVLNDSIKSVELNLANPPGRVPDEKLVILSQWFNKLDNSDRDKVLHVVSEAVHASVFGFLCVLDGIRVIEDGKDRGTLNLYYEKGEKMTLLNDPNDEYLHDML